ncbi:hypothetical protein MSPP1_001135 [Malassezia sp. CBS 17886]|nr:hypothetical protein MSPP1_001135 [Malassezia sp. CBS 17886]
MDVATELHVSVAYLTRLVQKQREAPPLDAHDAWTAFECALYHGLQGRTDASWHPAVPEKGSALRAVQWDVSTGSTHLDCIVLHAINVLLGGVDEPTQQSARAMRLLPTAFTLWCDPGCVSVSFHGAPRANAVLEWPDAIPERHRREPSPDTPLMILWSEGVRSLAPATLPAIIADTDDQHTAVLSPEAVPVHAFRAPDACLHGSHARDPVSTRFRGRSACELRGMHDAPAWDATGTSESLPVSPTGATPRWHARGGAFRPVSPRRPATRATHTRLRAEILPPERSPTDSNFTIHDNGNVGVLGSDVKLGCSSANMTPSQRQGRTKGRHLDKGSHLVLSRWTPPPTPATGTLMQLERDSWSLSVPAPGAWVRRSSAPDERQWVPLWPGQQRPPDTQWD